jgi:hypothetical protein
VGAGTRQKIQIVVIVDTGAWIRYFRDKTLEPAIAPLLESNQTAMHPLVLAELTMGGFSRHRKQILADLKSLPAARTFEIDDVLGFVETAHLHGTGLSYVDASILCSAIALGYRIQTSDKLLQTHAKRLDALSNPP